MRKSGPPRSSNQFDISREHRKSARLCQSQIGAVVGRDTMLGGQFKCARGQPGGWHNFVDQFVEGSNGARRPFQRRGRPANIFGRYARHLKVDQIRRDDTVGGLQSGRGVFESFFNEIDLRGDRSVDHETIGHRDPREPARRCRVPQAARGARSRRVPRQDGRVERPRLRERPSPPPPPYRRSFLSNKRRGAAFPPCSAPRGATPRSLVLSRRAWVSCATMARDVDRLARRSPARASYRHPMFSSPASAKHRHDCEMANLPTKPGAFAPTRGDHGRESPPPLGNIEQPSPWAAPPGTSSKAHNSS